MLLQPFLEIMESDSGSSKFFTTITSNLSLGSVWASRLFRANGRYLFLL
jgi:hypothetical protein